MRSGRQVMPDVHPCITRLPDYMLAAYCLRERAASCGVLLRFLCISLIFMVKIA